MSSADTVFRGEVPGGWLGTGVASGDVDGDGIDELIVGASQDATYHPVARPGLIYVFSGPLPRGGLTAGDASTVLRGAADRDGLGWAVEACDLDGDGHSEIIAGAPSHAFQGEVDRAGRVYVVPGDALPGSRRP